MVAIHWGLCQPVPLQPCTIGAGITAPGIARLLFAPYGASLQGVLLAYLHLCRQAVLKAAVANAASTMTAVLSALQCWSGQPQMLFWTLAVYRYCTAA